MKKYYFILFFATCIINISLAQFEKKTNIIGFQFATYAHLQDSFTTSSTKYRFIEDRGNNSQIFWMRSISKNQSAGVVLSFQQQYYMKNFFYGYKRNSIGGMLTHRLWFPLNKVLNFYAQSKLGYQRFWQEGLAGGSAFDPTNYRGNLYNYILEPGITYKLHKHVWLDLAWRNAFNLYYKKEDTESFLNQIPYGTKTSWGVEKQGLSSRNLQLGVNIIL